MRALLNSIHREYNFNMLDLLVLKMLWNNDEVESDDEGGEGDSANGMVRIPDPVGVDSVQQLVSAQQLDAEAELAAKMVKVGSFVLPSALSANDQLSNLNARFAALKQRTIAYKFADGWKTGRV